MPAYPEIQDQLFNKKEGKYQNKKFLDKLTVREKFQPEFLDKLMNYAILIQDLLKMVGIMLKEVQANLDLLSKKS